MTNWELVQWGVALCASLAAAITDIKSGYIPNVLTLPLWLVGVVTAAYLGGIALFSEAVGTSLILALPYILLFIVGHGGAGDAKLMGALGAWLGLKYGLVVLISVAITGMVLAVLRILTYNRRRMVVTNALVSFYLFIVELCSRCRSPLKQRHENKERQAPATDAVTIPYGIAIFIGVCISGIGFWIWDQ